jgi:hypothetical protein
MSVERELLLDAGGFDTRLPALEDIELGYRLGSRGMQIHYTRSAVKYMQRAYDFESFCVRCERTGTGLARLRAFQPELAEEYRALLLGPLAAELERDGDALTAAERRLAAYRADVLRLEGRPRLLARRALYRRYGEAFRTATLIGSLRELS